MVAISTAVAKYENTPENTSEHVCTTLSTWALSLSSSRGSSAIGGVGEVARKLRRDCDIDKSAGWCFAVFYTIPASIYAKSETLVPKNLHKHARDAPANVATSLKCGFGNFVPYDVVFYSHMSNTLRQFPSDPCFDNSSASWSPKLINVSVPSSRPPRP